MSVVVSYAIACIAPNDEAYASIHRNFHIKHGVPNSAWTDAAPPDPNAPKEYTYVRKGIKGHNVYLANAGNECYIPRLVDIMIRELKSTGVYVRMFLVADLKFIEDYRVPTDPWYTNNNCLIDTFPVEGQKDRTISPESQNNAVRLLTAVEDHTNREVDFEHKSFIIYSIWHDTDLHEVNVNICRTHTFHDLPAIKFSGLLWRADDSQNEREGSYGVVGTNFYAIIQLLGKLDAVVYLSKNGE